MPLRATWAGSRLLLRRLRDVMAAGGAVQKRLDEIVRTIARDMVAEVCSIYVRRAGDVIELFATEGLRPDSVHKIRFRFGEGIVGSVAATARPVAVADAQSHPAFVYRPETGEEIYSSMLGVPILHGGRVVGVLAIQNRTQREYTEEETETLETVGMVVAEMLASGEVVRKLELEPTDGLAAQPLRLQGVRMSRGLAIGQAVLHRPPLPVLDPIAEDEGTELQRLEDALSAMHSALDVLIADHDRSGAGGDHMDVLRAYRMFAEDRGWIRRIREGIGAGLRAEAAVVKVQSDMRVRMSMVQDPYLRERLSDFEDLANRLQIHLAGPDAPAGRPADLPDNAVLVARSLGPAELLDYDRSRLKAVVLEEGSAAAHVAIVARALDLPMVGRVRGVVGRVEPFDRIVVDGENAVCFVRPGEDFEQAFARSMIVHAERQAAYARERDLPAVTRDGEAVELHLNAGLLIDVPHLDGCGAAGIGLYRTEVAFMVRSEFPDVDAQAALYAKILEQAAGRPVVFRTLDIGGDKIPAYISDSAEENPAMGWRALRIGLDRPSMLRQQFRAMLRAAAGRPLNLMFPMVAEVAEFDRARALLDLEIERLAGEGAPTPEALEVGAMLEVPSLLFQLDALLRRIDFLSVGSNDLQQFLFACDRGNPRLDGRYDPLSPAMLSLLATVAESCRRVNVPVTVCGEMAGQPLEAMALVGLGYRALSMTASSVGPVRTMVRSLHAAPTGEFLRSLLDGSEHSLRGRLRAYARDHEIRI